jgi:predicted homoserine dehydrogenase-like protein
VIVVDTALRRRADAGRPLVVGIVGAGFMARGVVNQIVNAVPGMRVGAISNRTLEAARRAYAEAGVDDVVVVETPEALERAVAGGRYAITSDHTVLCRAGNVEALLEATGEVECGAEVVAEAVAHGKHVVMMGSELDATVGPILKVHADRAGVILTATDGDQPGVEMNLYRYVRSIGLTPLVCGNIKGLQDPYRTPATQAAFAARWGQTPHMVTSFADGTKISFEQAVVGNGTGMGVARRGMGGAEFAGHVDELTRHYDADALRAAGGVVDYVVGAKPPAGVYVIGTLDDPRQKHYLSYYKMGDGPLYSFYTPWHLCHFEAPLSLARAALLGDPVLQPLGAPVVEVVATAKRDIAPGEVIDGLGGFMTYGQCENAGPARAERLLPMGLAAGCTARRAVPRDRVLTYDDVTLPRDRHVDRLRAEQNRHFYGGSRPPAAAPPGRLWTDAPDCRGAVAS